MVKSPWPVEKGGAGVLSVPTDVQLWDSGPVMPEKST